MAERLLRKVYRGIRTPGATPRSGDLKPRVSCTHVNDVCFDTVLRATVWPRLPSLLMFHVDVHFTHE